MTLDIHLDPIEARLFGVLVEKALTTPEQYPLTVNAATNGANQKANRDPVLSLDEVEVEAGLSRLEAKYMARRVFPMNSRVEKFCHNGKDALALDAGGLAVIAELLMRGPQMPGELRTRVSRMVPMATLEDLASVLAALIDRGFVRRLPPLPGSRAERYVQLLSPDLHPVEAQAAAGAEPRESRPETTRTAADLAVRVAALEAAMVELSKTVEKLQAEVAMRRDPPGESTLA